MSTLEEHARSRGYSDMQRGVVKGSMTFPEPAVDARSTLHLQQPDTGTRDDPAVKVVYALTRDSSLQTRHLIVYNTGPVVGVDLPTLRRVFETYGTVERLESPNPSWARVHVSFDKVRNARTDEYLGQFDRKLDLVGTVTCRSGSNVLITMEEHLMRLYRIGRRSISRVSRAFVQDVDVIDSPGSGVCPLS